MVQFTEIFDKKASDEKNIKVSTGRAWKATELRLKNSEDLHKLWYVLIKEKNALLADSAYKKKIYNTRGPQGRMSKLKVSMSRLLTVVNERKKVRDDYRKSLEDEYVQAQRKIYEEKLREQEAKEVIVPELTHKLMREKYRDLRKGVDNTNYIQRAVDKINEKNEHKSYLAEKYDYKNKKIVPQDSEAPNDGSTIRQFSSIFQEQLKSGNHKISEEEVLRAHVKNWKMLNLKQRRIVINFLQARRARDAKKEFMKELDLLAQKIVHDEMQTRISPNESAAKEPSATNQQ